MEKINNSQSGSSLRDQQTGLDLDLSGAVPLPDLSGAVPLPVVVLLSWSLTLLLIVE